MIPAVLRLLAVHQLFVWLRKQKHKEEHLPGAAVSLMTVMGNGLASAEKERAEARRLAGQMLERFPDPLVLLNEAGAVVLSNPPAEPYLDRSTPSHPHLPSIYRDGEGVREQTFPSHDGQGERILEIREEHLSLPNETRLIWVQIRDVTQLRLEERRRQDMARLAAMGSGVSLVAHEVRNALQSLQMLIASEGKGCTALQEALQVEIDDLVGHMNGMLDFARPLPIERRPLDLPILLTEIVAPYREVAPQLQVDIPDGESCTAVGDGAWLRRALRNLIDNALQAGGEGVPLILSVRREPGYWWFVVEDGGPGLPQLVQDNPFAPFATARPGGTGLGLALVHKVALAHGGQARLCQAERGACIEFSIPDTGHARSAV